MSSTKQFLHRDRKRAVVCEWDPLRGGWRCSSREPGLKGSVTDLTAYRERLALQGYRELTPDEPA